MRGRVKRVWKAFRPYRRVAVVLLIAGLASAPWFWHFNSTLESVATNVFATVLVTPVLIFGVEQVLERVAARRNAPRDQAILSETVRHVARMLNGAISQATIPAYEDAFVAAMGEYSG